MKILKKLMKFTILTILSMGIFALLIFSLHYITLNNDHKGGDYKVYLYDNGMHIDIIIPENDQYIAYGWGSKIFFMEVPSWDDLSFKVGFQALFTKPRSCMRVNKYNKINKSWKEVNLSKSQLDLLKFKIEQKFNHDPFGKHIKIKENFYEANGRYWALNTCNTWVNAMFRECNLKCRLFTLTSGALSELYNK